MLGFYERYEQGLHQEVYDELLALQEHIHEPHLYDEALVIVRTMMRRVRHNLEVIVPRLSQMGYLFREGGFWENAPTEKQTRLKKEYPIFQPPTPETYQRVAQLEQLVGTLPLSLKCWYEEVGAVNFIGLFPSNERGYGPVLDPLCVDSVEVALQMVTSLHKVGLWEEEPLLILAPDNYHKYGYSGAGSYNMLLPCKAIDTTFLNEPHNTTFVNYLRICWKWGGFPGLERENRLTRKEFSFLTEGLLPF